MVPVNLLSPVTRTAFLLANPYGLMVVQTQGNDNATESMDQIHKSRLGFGFVEITRKLDLVSKILRIHAGK